mmetsp:Transcript_36882/g.59088  ORF Transcript_36882/g.59088 Transcript_36882/m.59088 type:complete len:257 (+) Transcript_36882:631-1401(+)
MLLCILQPHLFHVHQLDFVAVVLRSTNPTAHLLQDRKDQRLLQAIRMSFRYAFAAIGKWSAATTATSTRFQQKVEAATTYEWTQHETAWHHDQQDDTEANQDERQLDDEKRQSMVDPKRNERLPDIRVAFVFRSIAIITEIDIHCLQKSEIFGGKHKVRRVLAIEFRVTTQVRVLCRQRFSLHHVWKAAEIADPVFVLSEMIHSPPFMLGVAWINHVNMLFVHFQLLALFVKWIIFFDAMSLNASLKINHAHTALQ